MKRATRSSPHLAACFANAVVGATSSHEWAARSSRRCYCGADRQEALAYAERIRSAFAAADLGRGPLSISAGIAHGRGTDLKLSGLLHDADVALYAAKDGGRDRVVIHSDAQTSLLAR